MFSLSFILVLSFYVLRVLGIGCGMRKDNGTRGELSETQQVIKDLDEAQCMNKGKMKGII